MKKLLSIVLLLTIFVGCGTSPDFTKEQTIISKELYNGSFLYVTKSKACNGIFKKGEIYADKNFADVGDVIIIKNGKFIIEEKRFDKK